MHSKRALKFPLPNDFAPFLCIISKNKVGLSVNGFVNICNKYPSSSLSTKTPCSLSIKISSSISPTLSSTVFNILIFKYIFYFSNLIIISLLVYENYKLSISNQQLMNEIFLLILIHITFYLFPIIISFTLYFIFLHSIKVLKQEFDYLKSLESDLNLLKFIKLLYPHTFLSIVFLVIFLLLMNFGYINISVFLFSIIGISVITLPHAIIMTNFYNEN